jgi:hypothetical protein
VAEAIEVVVATADTVAAMEIAIDGETVIAMDAAIVIIAATNATKYRRTTRQSRTARLVIRTTIGTIVAALTIVVTTTGCTRAQTTDGADRRSIRNALTFIRAEPRAIVPAKATQVITRWLIAMAFRPDIAKATKIGRYTLWEESSGGSE